MLRAVRPVSRALLRSFATPAPLPRSPAPAPPPLPPWPHRQSRAWRPPPLHARADSSRQASARAQPSAHSHADPATWGTDPRARLLLSYHDLERALENRGLNRARVLIGGGLLLLGGVAVCWPRIKRWGAVEGAEVAAASLQEQQLQMQAAVMVRGLLQDRATGEHVEALLKQAVLGLLQDEQFYAHAVDWTARVLNDALQWDSVRQQGSDYVTAVFDNEESKESARVYLTEAVQAVVQDTDVQDSVATALWSGVRASIVGRRRKQVANNDGDAAAAAADRRADRHTIDQSAVATETVAADVTDRADKADNRKSAAVDDAP